MKNEALVRNVPNTRKAILALHSESLDETESFESISAITDNTAAQLNQLQDRYTKQHIPAVKFLLFGIIFGNIVAKFLQSFHDKSFDLGANSKS